MAGLEPAIRRCSRGHCRRWLDAIEAAPMNGRVKPGHGEMKQ